MIWPISSSCENVAVAQKALPFVYPVDDAVAEQAGVELKLLKSRFDLGRELFFETDISTDRTMSCATCHDPALGFSDGHPITIGVGGKTLKRNSPGLLNRFRGKTFMWDGRFDSLKEQALTPLENPDELAIGIPEALKRVKSNSKYKELFAKSWPGEAIDREKMASALATFVKQIRIPESPVDQFRAGNRRGLNKVETHGLWLFESKASCWKCHSGPDFTDEKLHNTGIGAVNGKPREGQFAITGNEEHTGRFNMPTLRGLTFTGPFMHDGRFKTLKEVVDFYNKGGEKNSHLDKLMKPLNLKENEVEALVAFLKSLSRPAEESPMKHVVPVQKENQFVPDSELEGAKAEAAKSYKEPADKEPADKNKR